MSKVKKVWKILVLIFLVFVIGCGISAMGLSCPGSGGNTGGNSQPTDDTGDKSEWEQVDNVRYAFAAENGFSEGKITTAVKTITLEVGKTYYLAFEFKIQPEGSNDGRGEFFANIKLGNETALSSTLQETSSGNLEEKSVADGKIIKLKYTVPERDARNVSIIIKLLPQAEGDSSLDVTFNAVGATVKDFPHIQRELAVGYTAGLEYETVGSTCTVKGIGTSTDKELIIPAKKDGKNVTEIVENAFKDNKTLTKISIPEYVTKIGKSAFSGCTNLTEIYFNAKACTKTDYGYYDSSNYIFRDCGTESAGITLTFGKKVNSIPDVLFLSAPNVKTVKFEEGSVCDSIGANAFKGCTSLESVKLAESVLSLGEGAFSGCTALNDLSLSLSMIAIAPSAFSGCNALVNLNMPDSIKEIGENAFNGCSALTSLTIPEKVTTIGTAAFSGCTNLTAINFNAKACAKTTHGYNATSNYIFRDCGTAKGGIVLTIGSKVTALPENFCMSAPKIKIVNFAADGVCDSIGANAFRGCTTLEEIALPENVTSIGESAFNGCTGLTELTISPSVTTISNYAFSGCNVLVNLTIPDEVTEIGEYAFNGCSALTSLTIPEKVTTIGTAAFSGCTNLTAINFNAKACAKTTHGYNATSNYIFRDCGTAKAGIVLTIGSKVTALPENFCMSAPKIRKVVFAADGVCDSIGANAFRGCTALEEIALPENVTSIGESAFNGCTGLTELTISPSVTTISNYAFSGCIALVNLTIPDGVTEIGENAFNGCSALTSLTIPEKVTTIGTAAFSGCTNLTAINFNAKACAKTTHGYNATSNYIFRDCGTAKGGIVLTIGSKVTALPENFLLSAPKVRKVVFAEDSVCERIGANAFKGCDKITEIALPESVNVVGENAFSGCTGLTQVNYGGTQAAWSSLKYNYNINLPAGCVVNCHDD